MKKLKTTNEVEQFITSPQTVSLLFIDESCPDCQQLKPFLPSLAQHYQSSIAWVERKDIPLLVKHYEVYGVPSLILFQHTREVARWVDRHPKGAAALMAFIERHR